MKISTKGRYALRLMLDLAVQPGDAAVPLRDVAERQEISDKYLEQIVTQLARGGLVRSVRGAGGGYLLTRAPEEYTVGEILRQLEGNLAPVSCVVRRRLLRPGGSVRHSGGVAADPGRGGQCGGQHHPGRPGEALPGEVPRGVRLSPGQAQRA